ncbi:hypothetical protein [Pelomicrobium sp. G1]|uniref:hypothetical protein n=1 Tax=unclassified Pelomicrobium TaxID=2815318 RepID=UPI0021DEDA58|nr:MAG: hypothetical protein KatS3mg123_3108 [Burkholderiales bacterium]
MLEFRLISPEEREAFIAALRRHGWRPEDFTLTEQPLDPATAEVEAETGEVAVACTRNHRVAVYPVGRGSSWVSDFADDLRAGRFGSPTGGMA